MSPPRRFPYRKLDATERVFIETRLVAGHSPAAIRDVMNAMTKMTPEAIERAAETAHTASGHTVWGRFSGRAEYTIEDVRRAYDRLRKSTRPSDIEHNNQRRRVLMGIGVEEDNRNRLADVNPNIRRYRRGQVRALVDRGMEYRLTGDEAALAELEDYYSDKEF